MSFTTGRSQIVKIGEHRSESIKITSGVPQGGIMHLGQDCPTPFLIYKSTLLKRNKLSFIHSFNIMHQKKEKEKINITYFLNEYNHTININF